MQQWQDGLTTPVETAEPRYSNYVVCCLTTVQQRYYKACVKDCIQVLTAELQIQQDMLASIISPVYYNGAKHATLLMQPKSLQACLGDADEALQHANGGARRLPVLRPPQLLVVGHEDGLRLGRQARLEGALAPKHVLLHKYGNKSA